MNRSGFFLILILFSCADRAIQPPASQINIDSLLDYHIAKLSESQLVLTKISNINNQVNSTDIIDARINWKNELASFRAIAAINKPIHSSSYTTKINADTKSNLIINAWETKSNLPLKELKVYYLQDYSKIKRLEATIKQQNFVFSSSQELSLDFSVLGINPITDKYKISGYQKFFWEEPQYFSLESQIHVK